MSRHLKVFTKYVKKRFALLSAMFLIQSLCCANIMCFPAQEIISKEVNCSLMTLSPKVNLALPLWERSYAGTCELVEMLTQGKNSEIDAALTILGSFNDAEFVHRITEMALNKKGLKISISQSGVLFTVSIQGLDDSIVGTIDILPQYEESGEKILFFQNISIKSAKKRGNRIFPLAMRWLDTNPEFVARFSDWQIEIVPANKHLYKSWLRSRAFLKSGIRYKKYKGGFYALYGKVSVYDPLIEPQPNMFEQQRKYVKKSLDVHTPLTLPSINIPLFRQMLEQAI